MSCDGGSGSHRRCDFTRFQYRRRDACMLGLGWECAYIFNRLHFAVATRRVWTTLNTHYTFIEQKLHSHYHKFWPAINCCYSSSFTQTYATNASRSALVDVIQLKINHQQCHRPTQTTNIDFFHFDLSLLLLGMSYVKHEWIAYTSLYLCSSIHLDYECWDEYDGY